MTNKFEVRRPKHAISEFSATLRFFAAVGPTAFSAVRTAAEEEAKDLGLPAQIHRQVLQFQVGQVPTSPPPAPLAGFGFQSFSKSGEVDTVLLCEPDNISLSLHDYSSWEDVCSQVVRTFGKVGRPYLDEVPALGSFTVYYQNEFRSIEPGVHQASEILREGTSWIAPFAHECEDAWHCNVGRFVGRSPISRYLINVNAAVEITPLPDKSDLFTVFRLGILISANYDIPGLPPLPVTTEGFERTLLEHFDDIHGLEKRVLAEVLSDPYLERIGAK